MFIQIRTVLLQINYDKENCCHLKTLKQIFPDRELREGRNNIHLVMNRLSSRFQQDIKEKMISIGSPYWCSR